MSPLKGPFAGLLLTALGLFLMFLGWLLGAVRGLFGCSLGASPHRRKHRQRKAIDRLNLSQPEAGYLKVLWVCTLMSRDHVKPKSLIYWVAIKNHFPYIGMVLNRDPMVFNSDLMVFDPTQKPLGRDLKPLGRDLKPFGCD